MIRLLFSRSRIVSLLAMAALALSAPPVAYAASPSPVGIWEGGSVDSVTHLFILDDNHYCLTLMAGNLDLLSAGRWEKQGDDYQFTETKTPALLFPMAMRTGPTKTGQRSVLLDGPMFSYAEAPVIGFLKNRTEPLSLRRLFASDKYSWSGSYDIPAATLGGARFIVIGDRADVRRSESVESGPAIPYQLTIYELGSDAAEYRISYNRRQAMPRLDFTANVSADTLTANGIGQLQRSKTRFSTTMIENLRRDCRGREAQEDEEKYLQSRGIKRLLPVETRTVTPASINQEPLFPDNREAEETDISETVTTLEPSSPEVTPKIATQTPAEKPPSAPGIDALEERFTAALKIKSAAKRSIAYDILWKAYINSRYDDEREVAARAAINMSNDLSSIGRYQEAIKQSNDAYAALITSTNPVLRSRASSLLNNQATAWEGFKRPDQQEEVWRRILHDFADDTYPTTIYVRASTSLNMVDRLILRGRKVEAAALLDAFERDYIASGRLAQRPEREFGINCDSEGGQFDYAVPCMASNAPDVAYFKRYVAAYRAKIDSMK